MTGDPPRALCAVVLAAGAGTRLAPLTALRPKALCPVGNVALLDQALHRLAALGLAGPRAVAVNAHHHPALLAAAVDGRAHLSVERPEALGTAGAVAALRDWTAGRDVLVCNADAYLAGGGTAALLAGWTGARPRLLVVRDPARGDFGPWRFAGLSLLPAAQAARLHPAPTGLYEVVWRTAWADGALELAPYDGVFVDCGTPADYLAANLHAARHAPGGRLVGPAATVRGDVAERVVQSVVGAGAVVEGAVTRSVVWPGGRVAPDEHLVDAVRTDTGLTVTAARSPA